MTQPQQVPPPTNNDVTTLQRTVQQLNAELAKLHERIAALEAKA